MSITQLGLTGTPSKQYSVSPKRAAATITKSIGTSGRDYSTMTAWEADLDNATLYVDGDDAVGECYNDSDFNESSLTYDGGTTVGLQSATLTVADGEKHDGTAGTGARQDGQHTFSIPSDGDQVVRELSWLELDGNLTDSSTSITISSTDSIGHTIKNLVIHGYGVAGVTAVNAIRSASTGGSGIAYNVLNTILYDINGSRGAIISGVNGPNTMNFINITAVNIDCPAGCSGIENPDVATVTVKNCIVTDMVGQAGRTECFQQDSPVNAVMDHNISDDATASGTGSLINKASVDQFVSTVDGSEDLHLKSGSDAIGAGVDLGTTPTGVEIDIDGRDRDAEGDTWDIGADQSVGLSGIIQLIMHNRRLMGVS